MLPINKLISHLGLVASISVALFSTTAQASCDSCTNAIIENTAATADNTATIVSYMDELVQKVSTAMFSSAPAVGGNMPAFVAIPATQNLAYGDQLTQLEIMEKNFQGSSETDQTLIDNYKNIFGNYLLQGSDSITDFPIANVSVASLYTDPSLYSASSTDTSEPNFYSDDQAAIAQKYIQIVSGSANSSWQKPDSTWLKIGDKTKGKDKKKIRKYVSNYYTYVAIQSAIADNFAYIYSMNTGYTLDGTLSNYDGSKINEMGLIDYLLRQIETEDWYTNIAALSLSSAMKVATVLLGGCFLELVRIEHVLNRLLVTQSAQSTLDVMNGTVLTQNMAVAEDNMPS